MVELLKAGQKDKARQLLVKKKRVDASVESMQKKIKFVEKQVLLLEENQGNKEFMDAMQTSNAAMAKGKVDVDKINDVLMDAKELKHESELAKQELDDMMDVDDDEDADDLAEMMKEYEDQVNSDLKNNFKQADKQTAPLKPTQQASSSKKQDFDDTMKQLLS